MLETHDLTPAKTRLHATFLVFALPALALTTPFGIGAIQAVALLLFAWHFRDGVSTCYRDNWHAVRPLVLAFGAFFLFSLLRMFTDHQPLRTLDGPSRMLFGLACIGVFYYLKPQARYFWLGLCYGTIAAAALAVLQTHAWGMARAEGFTHHAITFGDLALAMGMMAICSLNTAPGLRYLPALALLAGLLASALSGSRGGWLAMLLAAVPLTRNGYKMHGQRMLVALALAALLCVLAYLVPATGVAQRLAEGVSDIQGYFSRGDATTSVGIRLELWKASWLMFMEHPWLGVGRDDFDVALQVLAAKGMLQPSPALGYSSSHNDMLHFLATGGLLDFSLLIAMYVAPLLFFRNMLNAADNGQRPLALAGLVMVLCFIGFGLTDVMFWLMAPKLFYVTMACSLAGMCLFMTRGASQAPRRILVTRTDNIGDVVLTLPIAGWLKQRYPGVHITFLVRGYAAHTVGQCQHVDAVLAVEELPDLARHFRAAGYDTVLLAFPVRRIAMAAWRAGIARRIGTSHRFYHWLTCNRLVRFSRVKSSLHEAQLNFELLRPLGLTAIPPLQEVWPQYGLQAPASAKVDALLGEQGYHLVLHTKSNGNGREWPLEHFTALARLLQAAGDVTIWLTGSAAEGELLAQQAPDLLALPHVNNVCGKLDLRELLSLIGRADGLVASGTGPLHLAAALGRNTLGLFPPIKPIDIARWGALGAHAVNLCAPQACGSCQDKALCRCMAAITPQQVRDVVLGWRTLRRSAA
ncbi:glycosyltransferase family 9 protein [Pseudoduganella violaceinigra]|uniref:glycosyltransferase family 9 protein n=1 Tax=Pseudoduganella violaceinigra TaxID=246602 RepID=UPI000402630B|nr:glycosyltransferase family 9 protein [Pseudoduganella violaceinigra]